jgi:RNAse (barnase) inhibitor barstar
MPIKRDIQVVNSYHVETATTALDEAKVCYVINNALTTLTIDLTETEASMLDGLWQVVFSGIPMPITAEDLENLSLKSYCNP